MACSPWSSIRTRWSLRLLTALRHVKRFTSQDRRQPYSARSTEATTFSLRRAPSSHASLVAAIPRRRKKTQMASRLQPTIRTGHPMLPARALRTPQRNLGKRKRILYRRYLVSLGVRRRNPTRLSLSRRREIRHDQSQIGVSSSRSPLQSFDSLRRSVVH